MTWRVFAFLVAGCSLTTAEPVNLDKLPPMTYEGQAQVELKGRELQAMNVCMVAYTFYEADNRVRRYGESLARRGDKVDAIALRRPPPWIEPPDCRATASSQASAPWCGDLDKSIERRARDPERHAGEGRAVDLIGGEPIERAALAAVGRRFPGEGVARRHEKIRHRVGVASGAFEAHNLPDVANDSLAFRKQHGALLELFETLVRAGAGADVAGEFRSALSDIAGVALAAPPRDA